MIKLLQSGGNAAKYLLGGLLVVLSASMVTYLIPGFMSDSNTSASGTVATVAGYDIHAPDIQKAAADMEERSGQRYPEMMRPFLISQAANGLIQEAEINYKLLYRHFELILHNAGEGICALDREGKITFVNQNAGTCFQDPPVFVYVNGVANVMLPSVAGKDLSKLEQVYSGSLRAQRT